MSARKLFVDVECPDSDFYGFFSATFSPDDRVVFVTVSCVLDGEFRLTEEECRAVRDWTRDVNAGAERKLQLALSSGPAGWFRLFIRGQLRLGEVDLEEDGNTAWQFTPEGWQEFASFWEDFA